MICGICNKLNSLYFLNNIFYLFIFRLNEGFARYMQFVGTHAVKPEWQMVKVFSYLNINYNKLKKNKN